MTALVLTGAGGVVAVGVGAGLEGGWETCAGAHEARIIRENKDARKIDRTLLVFNYHLLK